MTDSLLNRAPLLVQGDIDDQLAMLLSRSSLLAWDIETSGLDWQQDRIGTCQLHSDADVSVIVQLNGRAPSNLRKLLADPQITKVFHHAPFDLRFMTAQWGVTTASVACTKVASKLLSPDAAPEAHSLKSLLAQHLDVHVEKGPVRTSDWSAAELTPEQLRYAAADVADLLRLYAVLRKELSNSGLDTLYDSCISFLPTRVQLEVGRWPDVFAY